VFDDSLIAYLRTETPAFDELIVGHSRIVRFIKNKINTFKITYFILC
jgi:hypothetical protein